MREGHDAVEAMLHTYPMAHVHFGTHESAEHFASRLLMPSMAVYEDDGCWLMLESDEKDDSEMHWFCPTGARLPAIRRMLCEAFRYTDLVWGYPPKNSSIAVCAGVLAHAIGGQRRGPYYVLSKDRFYDYNAGKAGM